MQPLMVHHDMCARNAQALTLTKLCDLYGSLLGLTAKDQINVSSMQRTSRMPIDDQTLEMIGYNSPMAKYLDVTNWARRDLFEFFRGYDNPYFNICTHLDVTKLLEYLHHRPGISVSLTFHYLALRVANEIEPFRYRLRDGKVIIHDVIHGGTIVLLPNESFNFAYFDYHEDFEKFIGGAQRAVDEAQRGDKPFNPNTNDNRIHFTVLPWVSFTSFAHARNWGCEDSITKVAFGKFTMENGRTRLPFSVEVHHALMDGLHVGRYLARFQELLEQPEAYMAIE
jgi:chloramphenicol O-acetyltransferase type A